MRFDAGAIAENRAGHLTPAQADAVRTYYRGAAARNVPVAMMMMLIVIIANALPNRTPQTPAHEWAIIAASIGVGAIALLSIWNVIAFGRDIAERKILAIDGPARRERQSARTFATYFLVIGGKRLKVDRTTYEMISPLQTYRAYYLPRSGFVVNLETL